MKSKVRKHLHIPQCCHKIVHQMKVQLKTFENNQQNVKFAKLFCHADFPLYGITHYFKQRLIKKSSLM